MNERNGPLGFDAPAEFNYSMNFPHYIPKEQKEKYNRINKHPNQYDEHEHKQRISGDR